MCHVSKNFSELLHRVKVYAVIYTLRGKSIDSYEMKIPQGDSGSTENILLGGVQTFQTRAKAVDPELKRIRVPKVPFGRLILSCILSTYR